jgi:hypothetical protein
MTGLGDFLYTIHDRPIVALGRRYKPPARFRHGVAELVAELPKQPNSDGYHVRVYESRLPARFYKVVALPSKNSCGEPRPGFTLSTGSSMTDLVGALTLAVNDGMLDIEVRPTTNPERKDP